MYLLHACAIEPSTPLRPYFYSEVGGCRYIISKILFYNFYFRNYSINLKFLKKLVFFKHLKFWIPLWLISDHRKIGTSLKSTIL